MFRERFPQYFRPSPESLRQLLAEGIIAFDTNVLLNLYRYSEATREDFLALYGHERVRDRVFLPHQVALEFSRNLADVRVGGARTVDVIRAYFNGLKAEASEKIQEQIQKTGRRDQHPHVDARELLDALEGAINDVIDSHLPDEEVSDPLDVDETLEALEGLFDGRVGDSLADEALTELKKEGERRYQAKIPPGYADASKKDGDPYGDLILWRQLIEHAQKEEAGIIFVTDDTKEDWFRTASGRTLGPRPELIEEMRREADQNFYAYNSTTFYTHAKTWLDEEAKEQSISESEKIRTAMLLPLQIKSRLPLGDDVIARAINTQLAPGFGAIGGLASATEAFIAQLGEDVYKGALERNRMIDAIISSGALQSALHSQLDQAILAGIAQQNADREPKVSEDIIEDSGDLNEDERQA